MSTVLTILGCAILTVCVFVALGVTPEVMMQDLMDMIRPSAKLRNRASSVQSRRTRGDLYGKLQKLKNSMEATGKGKYFPILITASGLLAVIGVAVAALLDNLFLAPTLAILMGMIPLFYAEKVIRDYDKAVGEEMETALSVITNAYLRQDDITAAIRETIKYIKPPLRRLFERYLAESAVNPAKKDTLYSLREQLDDQIWYEWCTILIQCQSDRNLKNNLQPTVAKLTDTRLVNDQVAGVIASAKAEFYVIMAFVASVFPMIRSMSPEAYQILVNTTAGKLVTGVVIAVVFITFLIMRRVTRPVSFDRKEGVL